MRVNSNEVLDSSMSQQIIGLLNPLLAVTFSLTFFAFWLVQKDKRYILAFAGAYLAFGAGIFVSNVAIGAESSWHVFGTHLFYSISALLLFRGVSERAGHQSGTLLALVILAGITPVLIWIHSVSGLANLRIIVANASYAAIVLLAAGNLWHNRNSHRLDYWLFILFILMAIQFVVRPAAVLAVEGELLNSEYRGSVYYSVLNLVLSFITLMMAITLFAVCGLDYVRAQAGKVSKRPSGSDPVSHDEKIRQLREVMETGLFREHDLTLNQLCQKTGIHEYQLRALINQEMGYRNFREFLNSYRLREVQAHLSRPEFETVPITTIALDAGFNSIPSFNRVFKAEFGVSPSEYRAENQQPGAARQVSG
ncbi:AraC-type DNA-binding protein [Parasphingorhabdus marina DSM 22363]|uniref:AraC-type DNA-binding protein n=2 Tax=Parasphingorhabdus marina TaxID=394732 RepID=A0A1N6CSC0_9SPHN|nr:AraC-type DNA-binding protein [Parasphingorhabdus marina DSM 22363]